MKNYHAHYFLPDSRRDIVWQEIVRYLSGWVPMNGSILELGAGYCNCINAIDAKHRTAVDIWPGFTRHADKGVRCHVYDIRKGLRHLLKGSYDCIIASNVLEHLTMDEGIALLADCGVLLAKDGSLILIQPNFSLSVGHYFDDYTHKTVFTDHTLGSLLVALGFAVSRIEPGFLPFTMKSRLPVWRYAIRWYLRSPVRPLAGQMLVIAKKP